MQTMIHSGSLNSYYPSHHPFYTAIHMPTIWIKDELARVEEAQWLW